MPIKNEPRRWLPTLVAGLFALILILVAFQMDNSVGNALRLRVGTSAHQFASFLSKIGDWPSLLAAGVLLSLVLYIRGRIEFSRLLLVVLVAGSLAGLSATVIRSTVGRTRPSSKVPQGFYGPYYNSHWTVGRYEFGSFPSGHTATVAGLTAALWMWRRRLALTFAIFAAAVAWSRMALNCHHFSDVTAAAVWGAFVAPWLFLKVEPRLRGWARWCPARLFVPKSKDDPQPNLESPPA